MLPRLEGGSVLTRRVSYPQPFLLLARSLLLAIESGQIEPDAAGSGVSYGSRELRRVSSWNSGGDPEKRGLFGGKCC